MNIKLNQLSEENMHSLMGGQNESPYLACGCSCSCDNCQQNKGSINKSTRRSSRRDVVNYPSSSSY